MLKMLILPWGFNVTSNIKENLRLRKQNSIAIEALESALYAIATNVPVDDYFIKIMAAINKAKGLETSDEKCKESAS